MIGNIFTFFWLYAKENGWPWVVKRAFYEFKVKSRWLNMQFRRRPWDDNELKRWLRPEINAAPDSYYTYWKNKTVRFFFSPADRDRYSPVLNRVIGQNGREQLVAQARAIHEGRFEYFFSQEDRLGLPPDWHLNPFTGQRTDPRAHWNDIPIFTPHTGDIKFIWEPGRFAHAYLLSRAYLATDDLSYAETFWQIVESWHAANPPNHGAHWKCGQEISLRLLAWCFALYAFADSPATTSDRLALLLGMVAAQTERVFNNHVYAYLQRNNHAISEGVGLWTVGILFPELKRAKKWREAGQNILEEEAKRQIYDDGSYIQHSTNYHRLMLQDYLWAIRLGELNGYEFSSALLDRVRKAGEFLYQFQDKETGFVPYYGPNDGALILPFNSCDYKDFRPVLGSIHYLFTKKRLYTYGLWDEDLVWIFGPEALEGEPELVERKSLDASIGGYYTLRGEKSWGMIRCATYQDRPSQADMLHLDIWRKGINVACDAGSYLYFAEPPWDNALVSTRVHNTVLVDGLDQMKRGPRFLWLNWLKSEVRHNIVSAKSNLAYFEGEHYGYKRLQHEITHRRAVLKATQDIWIIVDDLLGDGEHEFKLHWLLADLPYNADTKNMQVSLDTGADRYELSLGKCLPESALCKFDVVRGTEESAPRGWHSPYYGMRFPALSVTLSIHAMAPCRLFSVFAPERSDNCLSISEDRFCFHSENLNLAVDLCALSSRSVITQATLNSESLQDQILVT